MGNGFTAQIKETTAKYYENLYGEKNLPNRPFNTQLKDQIKGYVEKRYHEDDPCNYPPSLTEISEIISQRKNGKSTTDFRNEMLKKTGITRDKYVFSIISTIWDEENVPEAWKKGLVTSIWKGKGDREQLK